MEGEGIGEDGYKRRCLFVGVRESVFVWEGVRVEVCACVGVGVHTCIRVCT